MMETKTILRIVLVPMLGLLVPAVAMRFSDEVKWGPADFVAAWLLMTGVGVAYALVTRRSIDLVYRAAVGVALAAGFLLIWSNLAVGVIGNEDHPANLLYHGVLVIGLLGAALSRLTARGMMHAMWVTALAQASVPLIALSIWRSAVPGRWVEVIGVNSFFVLLFAGSALLFRHAAQKRLRAGDDLTV